ncbi:TIGR02099 family protein [Pseudidiomarina aestuarii]|uniref:TIGR02099 family protein n=3 Tax=Pseudidiomarina aestuarii TaxID=624146 RepID=A0A6N4DCW6_9GAMM|nr:TIGR02099 family protein [Pseudidiomarina aestuarii]
MWRLSARWAYRTLLYSVATALVLFAVLLTILRYLLPQLPDLTTQAEAFVQQQYDVQATIGRLSADWRTSGPQIVLHELAIQSSSQQATRVQLPEARVHLNFWDSLRTWTLQFEQITLADAKFTYDLRDVSATEGLPTNELIPRLLLNQLDLVVIEDSTVELINLVGVQRVIEIARLSWMNDGSKHQGTGQLRIADFTENTLDIVIDIEGNDLQALAGQVYVNAENLDITPWLQQQVIDTEIETAEFNFTLWLNFADSTFNDGSLQLGRNALRWRVDDRDHRLVIPAGLLKLNPIANGWLVNSNPITVQHDDSSWQLPSFSWQRDAAGQAISIEAAPLAELAQLLTITGSAGAALSDDLAARQLTGRADVVAHFPINESPQWWLYSDDLSWQEAAGIPGLTGVNVELWGQDFGAGSSVQWHLSGIDSAIRSEALSVSEAWQLPRIDTRGELSFNQAEQTPQWRLQLDPSSRIELPGLPLRLQGTIAPQDDSVYVDVALHSTNQELMDVSALRDHLPIVMGGNLQDYLSTAMVEAQVDDLAMVWRGKLNDFPYVDGSGVFQARTRLEQLTYQFRSEWLPLTESRTIVDFHNERMHIAATGSRLGNMQLPIVHTRIPNLIADIPELVIDAEISGAAQELQPVFAESPLANSLGTTFTQLKLAGPLNGEMKLTIPLKGGGNVVAEGYANLADNDLFVEPLQQQFRDLNGVVRFRNAEIESEDLLFSWLGQIVEGDLNGAPDGEDYRVDLGLTGAWQNFDSDLVSGVFDWTGRLQLVLEPEAYSFNWQQRSDLAALELELPTPLRKSSDVAIPWQLQVSGGNDSILINSQYGDQALLELQLDGAATELQQGFLRVGEGVPSEPNPNTLRLNPNFMVEIGHDEIVLEDWIDTIAAFAELGEQAPAEGRERYRFLRPDYIEVVTPAFQFGDHQLSNFDGILWPTDEGWLFRANADQAQLEGSLMASAEAPLAVTINADYLELEPPVEAIAEAVDEEVESIAEVDLRKVPQIDFSCQRCRYGEYPLGEVAFSVAPDSAGLRVSNLRIANNGHVLTATGLWQQGESIDTLTRMEGNFSSDDLGAFLSDYNITTMVQDSPASMDFDLSWQGAPDAYNPETLNGQVDWRLGQGYLNEVSDGGARIFSLLSLEGILRKLRFDFRDVFANGLFYTSFGGTFAIENGLVRTDNTVMNGSAGDMDVAGQTNLVTRAIDYQLFFAPKVTSSLPVILAWMVNPPSGLAALLIDRMLQNAQVISRLEYKISGTMDEPVVEEVARSSREVTIPQDEEPAAEPEATEVKDDNSIDNTSTDKKPSASPASNGSATDQPGGTGG